MKDVVYKLYLKEVDKDNERGYNDFSQRFLSLLKIGDAVAVRDITDELGGSNYYIVVERNWYEEPNGDIICEIVAEAE